MNWFYLINDHRHGPVTEVQLEALRREAGINDETLVWRKGLPGWMPLRSAWFMDGGAPPEFQICTECRNFFPRSEMIAMSRAWVCARCKPVYLQRVTEGIAPVAGLGLMWREGGSLVMNLETQFPDRCIRCNEPADGQRLECQIQYAPSGRLVLSHTPVKLEVGLCDKHRRQRLVQTVVGWLVAAAGLGLMILVRTEIALMVLLVGIGVAGRLSPQIAARKMKDGVLWLRGVGKPFLAGLPDWDDRR